MNTVTLFRPVGIKELLLIKELQMNAFPPRLSWQPIFYPVLNQPYAEQIAREWNTKDEFSGFAGFVTAFEIPVDYFNSFEVKTVGGEIHQELWVPSEELEVFNGKIVNGIRVVSAFYGPGYRTDEQVTAVLRQFSIH